MNYTTKQIAEITQYQLIGDKDLPIQHIAFDREIYILPTKLHLLPLIPKIILAKNIFLK